MEHIRKKVAEMEKKNKFSNVDAEALQNINPDKFSRYKLRVGATDVILPILTPTPTPTSTPTGSGDNRLKDQN